MNIHPEAVSIIFTGIRKHYTEHYDLDEAFEQWDQEKHYQLAKDAEEEKTILQAEKY